MASEPLRIFLRYARPPGKVLAHLIGDMLGVLRLHTRLVQHVFYLSERAGGPPYPYLKDRGMWRPYPQWMQKPYPLSGGRMDV